MTNLALTTVAHFRALTTAEASNPGENAGTFLSYCKSLPAPRREKVPPFKIVPLIKHPGNTDVRPHDCLENLTRKLKCTVCGARYEKGKHDRVTGLVMP